MSDFPHSNARRSDGISVRGLVIAVLVLVALAFAMALIGGANAPLPEDGVAQPAAVPPTPAPATNN